ncbi:MAG: HAMP domain-containing protein [Desulfobacteraceae bacterium]|nr:HAMP domain-containing protein [Desulfobacteraceae bacterium]
MEKNKQYKLAEWGPLTVIAESIRNKLMISLLTLALIPLIFLGIISYKISSEALMKKTFDSLEAFRNSRAHAVEKYFEERHGDMKALNEMVKTLRAKAFSHLASIQQLKKSMIETYFEERINNVQVMSRTPFIVGALASFGQAGPSDGSAWKAVEKEYGPGIEKFSEIYGYYDTYLVTENGDVVYTVAKEADLGQNLLNGRLKHSPAGKAFRQGLRNIYFQDFESYEPSDGENAAFIAAPVRNQSGVAGVFMVQVSVDQINFIMQERRGLGQSGESYLVGPDGLFRSNSFHIMESTIMNPAFAVDTKGTAEALTGKTGEAITVNYRGEYVLSSWTPVKLHKITWAMLGEIEVSEAFIPKEKGEGKDFFTRYKEKYGYENIALLNPDGFLFFSVVKGKDYRTNMLTGPYRNTNLGRLFSKVLETKEPGMADFEKYHPFGDRQAAFVAIPVLSDKNKVEVVVAAQLSTEQINSMMLERTGLGETGETYLVGSDKMFRSKSAFREKLRGSEKFESFSTVMNPNIIADTPASVNALAGKKGSRVINNYRNVQVLSSWCPVTVSPPTLTTPKGIRWAVIAEFDYEEVVRPVTEIMMKGVLVFMATALVVVVGALMLSQSLTTQVNHIMNLIDEIGRGNFDARTPVNTRDELGVMALSLNAMLDNLLSLIKSEKK